jgi:ribosomal-protein-alanine N-acetyltransferase
VTLRPLHEDDADAVFRYARDPEVTRFLPWDPAPDVASIRAFLRDQVAKRRYGEALPLAIVLRETGEMVGSTDLMDLHKTSRGKAELGYLLARPFWGRGLMSEAAALTARHGFEALGLTRIVAFADAENVGSCRVLEKIGMRAYGDEIRIVKSERRRYLRFAMSAAPPPLPPPPTR